MMEKDPDTTGQSYRRMHDMARFCLAASAGPNPSPKVSDADRLTSPHAARLSASKEPAQKEGRVFLQDVQTLLGRPCC